jgi:hypothetical protein
MRLGAPATSRDVQQLLLLPLLGGARVPCAGAGSAVCVVALQAECGTLEPPGAPPADTFACVECAGAAQSRLTRAGCDNQNIAEWCSGMALRPLSTSALLTAGSSARLDGWLGASEGLANWTICFSSTLHPNTAQEFHRRCDGFDQTLTVGNNSLGFTFGGIAYQSWGGTGWKSGAAAQDWLFTLGPRESAQFKPLGPRAARPLPSGASSANDYQFSASSHWPEWGGGGDLRFGHGGPPGADATCNQGYTYAGSHDEACGGGYNWGKTELEVWRRAPPTPEVLYAVGPHQGDGCQQIPIVLLDQGLTSAGSRTHNRSAWCQQPCPRPSFEGCKPPACAVRWAAGTCAEHGNRLLVEQSKNCSSGVSLPASKGLTTWRASWS